MFILVELPGGVSWERNGPKHKDHIIREKHKRNLVNKPKMGYNQLLKELRGVYQRLLTHFGHKDKEIGDLNFKAMDQVISVH